MSRLCRLFVIFIAAYTAAGCAPVGSIGGSGAIDFLLVVPNPIEYKVGETFIPGNGSLRVYVPSQGTLVPISLSQVAISVSEPPYKSSEIQRISSDSSYTLKKTGRIIVIVEYLAMTASCYIDVLSATGSGATSGIIIIWEGAEG